MVVLSELSKRSTSSFLTHGHRYDVFLSFRGIDTRYSFTDYLHKALMDANITTFLDNEEIETGEDLKPELVSAIKASRTSIIVLSKNYASSTWCLDELVLILEQRMTSNQIVIPIFYHVEPTHVRKLESSFGDAMAKHKHMMEAETNVNKRIQWAQKMDRWKKALIEVVNLKGKDVNGRLETEFIGEVVEDIYRKLHIPIRSTPPLLMGMDYSINFITSWLKDASSHTTDILTILGMGGIGKTSLAKYVYNLHCREFHTSSYIEDIGRRCDQKFDGLLDIQKQLCSDISKSSSVQVNDVSTYISMIENLVARKKIFLVLDDIDSLDQLNSLLGSKGLHPGSKIIITTKDAWLTESCTLFKMNVKPKHIKHMLQGLHETEARQLLFFHAFMSNDPMAAYEVVSEKLVKYCEGHPLALEVLGKSLHNRDVAYWEGYIEGLKKETGSHINNVLRISFDSLPFKNDKDLFKYIACFFVGSDREVTETILEACGINTRSGITNLIDRCLLSIGWNNKLVMHQLLQNMGKSLVHQESPDKPWKQSLLWCHEESFKVLKQKKGKGNLLGLALDMRMLEKEKLRASFVLKTDALSNMDNLMLLQLNYVQVNGSYENFPEELRWLCMHGFPLKSIPLDLPMENLVALDMSYSNIESFGICYSNPVGLECRQKLPGMCVNKRMFLGSLKVLNLSFCERLRSLGSFEELPALERLLLSNCVSLLEVCESIEACIELVLVDLSYCIKLEKCPRTIGMLNKVKTLLLDGCNLGESQIEIGDTESLEILETKNISISANDTSSAILVAIPSDLKLFTISLPRSLVSLSLANSNLSTKSFPMDFRSLSMLEELYLDENPIVSLPNCVRNLPRLEMLSMQNCKLLKSVEHPPSSLKELILYSHYKPFLQKLVFNPEMAPLELYIDWKFLAYSLFEIEGIIKIQPMAPADEKLLHTLSWNKPDFLNKIHVRTDSFIRGPEESEIQIYYEFGIFSTIYGGEEMPNWIRHRNKGSSISFTIPSSSNRLRGVNFSYVQTFRLVNVQFLYLPFIVVSNVTKNHTWIYKHYTSMFMVDAGEECLVLLSHWMFGVNEIEGGDHITVTLTEYSDQVTKECGVSFVWDDEKTKEDEEEDVLSYYKSWNHIIGGDLSAFQTTTGEYILNTERFMLHDDEENLQLYREFVGDGAKYKEELRFRALSKRKSNKLGDGQEDVRK